MSLCIRKHVIQHSNACHYIFKNMFAAAPTIDYAELVKNGAIIVDVRTKGEFQGGHIKGSINIPLDTINSKIEELKIQ